MKELTRVEKMFEGQAITAYLWDGAPVWIAKEVGKAMGYSDEGRGLVVTLRQKWKEDLIYGTDYKILDGEPLTRFKEATHQPIVDESGNSSGNTGQVDRSPSLLILKESGFHAVCLKTDKPIGVRLRRWLAEEVLPSLVRTGGYQSQPRSTKEVFESYKPAVLEGMAKKAAEGDVEAAAIYLKLGRPSHHKKPAGESRSPTPPRAAPKTKEIEALLLKGLSPQEVYKLGFVRSQVYLIAARLRAKKPAPN